VVVGSELKRLSVSSDEDTLPGCSLVTINLGYNFVLLKDRLVPLHDGLVNPISKDRSTGIHPVPIELVQKFNARKEAIKVHYVFLVCQGPIEIKDNSLHRIVITNFRHYTQSRPKIDFELIGEASVTATTPNFEAALGVFSLHRLPEH